MDWGLHINFNILIIKNKRYLIISKKRDARYCVSTLLIGRKQTILNIGLNIALHNLHGTDTDSAKCCAA